ncbi:MAG: hypothetical protein A2005_00815 [Desulfuromonadales bacterium GWC2_61_20]|nr:MAG: hypothetical protein A2005_00815 [Desulfuromonadales bacterium GWC2_61_20]
MSASAKLHLFVLLVFVVVLIWSAILPFDFFTWLLEVFPALVGAALLARLYPRWRLTDLALVLVLVHAVILMVGGHYTYAEVPLFSWIRDLGFGTRNNYDKVGHFAQGFIPAIVAREVLLRNRVINGRSWLAFVVVCICLAISAFYELIEWLVAVLAGAESEAFLGTQGYVWDTQTDMALALFGAVCALIFLSRQHDRRLAALAPVAGEVRG